MIAIKPPTLKINVNYLTRVEGHAHIVVDIYRGVIRQCDLQIVEAPRYVEAMLRGLPYSRASVLASRICGICAVTHTTASLRAVEMALGIELSPQTTLLRQLSLYAEMLDSHILHTMMLVAPDILGLPSAMALAQQQPEVVQRALRMKQAAGELSAAICGRHTHPIALVAGGFTHYPTINELATLHERLVAMRGDMSEVVSLWQTVEMPIFSRAVEYLALRSDQDYGFLGDVIASSDGRSYPVTDYRQVVEEYQVSHATAKLARYQGSYMVGALARFNLNHDKLHPQTQAVAQTLHLWPGSTNPYLITLAQVVEMVHCLESAITLIEELITSGITPEPPGKPERLSGIGVGACEAPRGALYHQYTIKNGIITDANCVIPTAQNLANIEADMHALLPEILDRPPEEIALALEMLVRAYDPCISCATHMLEVEFV